MPACPVDSLKTKFSEKTECQGMNRMLLNRTKMLNNPCSTPFRSASILFSLLHSTFVHWRAPRPGCCSRTVRNTVVPDGSSLLPAHQLVQRWHLHPFWETPASRTGVQGRFRHPNLQGTYFFSCLFPFRWDTCPQQQSDPHLIHTQTLPAVNYSLCQCRWFWHLHLRGHQHPGFSIYLLHHKKSR